MSPEDAPVQWKGEESSGKASIGWHGNEKVRIIVSESSEGREHLENFMGCTVHTGIKHNEQILITMLVNIGSLSKTRNPKYFEPQKMLHLKQ